MNGELVDAPAKVDAHTVALPELRATFTFDRPEQDRLRRDGRASATFKEVFVRFSRC
jgi:hypothetical protein